MPETELRKARKNARMSLARAAAAIGKSAQTLSLVERGLRWLKLDLVMELGRLYGCDHNQLGCQYRDRMKEQRPEEVEVDDGAVLTLGTRLLRALDAREQGEAVITYRPGKIHRVIIRALESPRVPVPVAARGPGTAKIVEV